MKKLETLTFKKFCMTIGNLPSSYIESLSYYECLLWLCNYLQNTVIPTVNNNGEAVTELQNLFVELQQYVNNYFDNLDVQEEINNKLDDMVEQGTLQEIIADYLNSRAVFGFDSVSDMVESTNLINGSYAKTLGYYSKNDGGSGLYKIRTVTNDDVVDGGSIIEMKDNTLIAELIISDKVNVKQFGAKGDGTTDDTTSIQNAINYCLSNNKSLYIDKDTYYISDTLTINSDNVFIRCEGTITTDQNITCILYNGLNSDIYINKITNSNLNKVGTAFLSNKKMSGVKLQINYIEHFNKGISLDLSSNNSPFGIFYNYITNDYIDSNYCIYLDGNYSFVNNNYFYLAHLLGGTGIYSAAIDNTGNVGEYNGNVFYNCGFELLTKAVILNNFTLNSILNFRFLEDVTDTVAFVLNNSTRNKFTSEASLLLYGERISDNHATRNGSNMWKVLIRKDSNSWDYADEFITYNNLIEVTHNLGLNPAFAVTNSVYHTNSSPLSCYSVFYVEASNETGSKIYLDERYTHAKNIYDNLFVTVYMPNGNQSKLEIYYEGSSSINFTTDNFDNSAGRHRFIGRIGPDKKFIWEQIS